MNEYVSGQSSTGPTPAAGKPRRGLCLLPILLVIAGVLVVYWIRQKPIPVQNLAPETSAGVAVMDGSWWVENTRGFRELREVKTVMQDFERDTGVSVENELLPVIGEVAVVVTDIKNEGPDFSMCIKPKDLKKAFKTFRKLTQKAETDKWAKIEHVGVQLMVLPNTERPRLVAGMDRGWALFGTEDSVKQVIDSANGKRPSIARAGRLKDALPSDSGNGVLRLVFDQNVVSKMPELFQRIPPKTRDQMDSTMSVSVAAKDDGFTVRFVQTARNAAAIELGKAVAVSSGEPWSIDQQLPNDTVAWWGVKSLSAVWKAMWASMKEAGTFGQDAGEIEKEIYQKRPWIGTALDNMKQLAIAGTLRDDKEFGLILAADAGSEEIARNLCEGIVREVSQMPETVISQQGSRWTLNVAQDPAPEFPTEPTLGYEGSIVRLTTHASWLDAAKGRPKAELPSEAGNASMSFTANLAFVDSIVNAMEKAGGAERDAIQLVRDMKLSDATVRGWSTMKAEGETLTEVEVSGWPWKTALDSVQKYVKANENELGL